MTAQLPTWQLALLLDRARDGSVYVKTDDDIVTAAAYIDPGGDVIIMPARIEEATA